MKDNDVKAASSEEDCAPGPDCEISGSKCCEEIPPPVSSCDDNSADCRLFGVGCCEDNSILNESPCVPDEESCDTFGEGCCQENPAPVSSCDDKSPDCVLLGEGSCEGEKVFGDSGLLMAMIFCVESPNVCVTVRS